MFCQPKVISKAIERNGSVFAVERTFRESKIGCKPLVACGNIDEPPAQWSARYAGGGSDLTRNSHGRRARDATYSGWRRRD